MVGYGVYYVGKGNTKRANRKGVSKMSEREQEDKLLQIFRELGKEDRPKLLNVGEIMIALKNLPSPPKASA